MQLNHDEFASRAGMDLPTLRKMMALGILPEDDPIDDDHVPRAMLVLELQRSGVRLEDLGGAISRGDVTLELVDRSFSQWAGLRQKSYAAHAEELGLSVTFSDSVRVALGVSGSSADSQIPELDASIIEALSELVALGFDEDVAARLFQLMADYSRRTVQATSEMWSTAVRQPLLDAGISQREMFRTQTVDFGAFPSLGERLVVLLWRRFLDEQIYRGTTETLEYVLEKAGVVRTTTDRPPAIVFLDLTAFTHITDHEGDEVAAAGARELTDVVRRVSVGWEGTLVKMLGDGAMLHFADPAAAVHCCLSLRDAIADAGLPAARFGVNAGPLMVRDVDFYGHTVNVAARLLDYARPYEILVTSDVTEAIDTDDLHFTEVGPVSLKGVSSLVTVLIAAAT